MTLSKPGDEVDHSWWGRASGGREVLRVAAPLVVSSLSWTVMTFVDRVFLNWVAGAAMAAAFAASMVWFVLLCLPLGICAYANTFVAQYDGARQKEKIGLVVWQAVWTALLFSPIALAAIPFARPLFALAGHEAAVFEYEVEYFQILCWGGPAILLAQAGAAFYSGRGETSVVMWTDAAFAIVNLVLDYLWIFGYAGFPEMGIAGAGWATVLSLWLKAAAYLLLMLQRQHRIQFGTLRGLRLDTRLLGRLLYFGGPSGLQMLLDVVGFTVFVMLVGRLGAIEAEATSMAFSISTLAFMPIWGLHLAVTILVGERLGENRDDLAERATYTTLVVAWIYMATISLVYVLAPQVFLQWFFPNSGSLSADELAVWELTVLLLRFVAAYNLLDATFMIFAGAVKGAGDTIFVLRISLVLATLLAGLTWFSVEVWQLGIYGCWWLVTGWVWIAALAFYLRFRGGKWRSMRVIEQRPPDPAEPLALVAD